jgi:hypothetical protein
MDIKTRTFYSHKQDQWDQADTWIEQNKDKVDIITKISGFYDKKYYQLEVLYREKGDKHVR